MSQDQLLNYPIALLQRFYSSKITKDQFNGFNQLKRNKRFINKAESQFDTVCKIQKELTWAKTETNYILYTWPDVFCPLLQ
mgnify:CR=1 FL=1